MCSKNLKFNRLKPADTKNDDKSMNSDQRQRKCRVRHARDAAEVETGHQSSRSCSQQSCWLAFQ